MDREKFLVICRLMADGNTITVSTARVCSDVKEFRKYAFRNLENYKMYCAAHFLYGKFLQRGDNYRPLFYRKSPVLNIQERLAMETCLRRKGLTGRDIRHSR